MHVEPSCWHLRCRRLCCCTVVRAETTARSLVETSSLYSSCFPRTGSTLTNTTCLPDRWTQQERARHGGGDKAPAHRFAIFGYDFSQLLLHKKGRILDYLWHSKPKRVEGFQDTKRTLQPRTAIVIRFTSTNTFYK